jgi:RNA polymerase sigma factor (sigma-70 family)
LKKNESCNQKQFVSLTPNGDELAFVELYELHRNKIYSDALRITKSVILAEEVLQDVFLKLWLRRADINKIENLESYLHTMTRNLIFDHLKKVSYQVTMKKKMTDNERPVSDTDFLIRQHQCQLLLAEAVNRLHPQQKIVYQLAKIEGLSHELIAHKLKISRLTVKKHMANSLSLIREYFNKCFFSLIIFLISGLLKIQ